MRCDPFLPERGTRLTAQQESSVTEEKIDAFLKELGKLGLKAGGRDVSIKPQCRTRVSQLDLLFRSCVGSPPVLQNELKTNSENVGRSGNIGNLEGVSYLMDDVRCVAGLEQGQQSYLLMISVYYHYIEHTR